MKKDKGSFSAIMTAYMRTYHAKLDNPKIFDDILANSLIPDDIRAQIEESLDKPLISTFSKSSDSDQPITLASLIQTTNPISRARYVEDTLEKAVRQGAKQYVILGAGMDTFAFRRPDLMEKLEVFEVDHPATQELKLHRLAELGWKLPAKLHFIPIDFTQESVASALTRSLSYNPKVKSLFSWLGVVIYLTREVVFATLRSITDIAPAGSMVLFDYTSTDAFNPEKSSPQMQKFMEFGQKIGEPMITGFNPSALAEDLENLGFHLYENLSPADIEILYFKGREDEFHAQEHGHIACAVVD
jgi:methyltransferase (TIGR00027 family)